jgi:hypothetical protein
LENNYETLQDDNPFDMHGYKAIRSTFHEAFQTEPHQLVIGRDIIQNIALKENWDKNNESKRTLLISPIKKKSRVEFLMDEWLETKCY